MRELETCGQSTDETTTERSRGMLNINRTGKFLATRAARHQCPARPRTCYLEWYSMLELASAASAMGGHVTTAEPNEYFAALLAANADLTICKATPRTTGT